MSVLDGAKPPPFAPSDEQTMVYTVDLGDGRVVDIEGPKGATPDQLHAAAVSAGLVQAPAAEGAADGGEITDEPVAQARLSPEDEKTFRGYIAAHDPRGAEKFAASRGFQLKNADQLVAAYDHFGKTNPDSVYQLEKVDTDAAGALGRGLGDTISMGTLPKVGAVIAGAEAALTGGDFGDAYDHMLDANNAAVGADERDHPWMRLSGQLLGGLAIPTGLEGVGLKAGSEVLRAGGTMQEARAAAAIAVRNRSIAMGAGFGAAHGAGSSDSVAEIPGNVLVEGGLGALGGAVAGKVNEALAPRVRARAVAARTAPDAMSTTQSATSEAAGDIAQTYGIRPTPATVGGGAAHAAQMALGNVPGGMTAVAKGVQRENDDVAAAVRNIAEGAGTVSTREGAGQAAIEGAQTYRETSRAAGSELYRQRDALMGGDNAPVTLDNTKAQIADIASKYPTSQTLAALMQHPVIRKLASVAWDARQRDGLPAELTLGEATDALSHVRGVSRALAKNTTDSDLIMSRVNDVKNALSADVMRAAAAADIAAGREPGAEGSAVAAQMKADRFWADRKQALAGTLKAPLTSGAKPTERSAESVYNQIDADTSRVGGNLARLRDTWFRLPEGARGTIAATKIDDMGRSLPGQQNSDGSAWSFERFLTNFDRMSPQARNIMFGQDAAKQLQDIAAYSSRLRDLGRSRNFSNTAKNYIAGAILTTVGTALWHGAPMEAVEAAASIPASYAAATLFLKTPAMRQWTQSALKVAAISNPERSKAAGDALVRRLSAIARAEPAIANEALSLQQRLSEAFAQTPQRAAAGDRKDRQ